MPNYYFSRLEHLDNLIRLKATGAPKTLTQKPGISLRAVYDYINPLKSLGSLKIRLAGLLLCLSSITTYGQAGEGKYILHVTIEGSPVNKVYGGTMNDHLTLSRLDSICPQNGQFSLQGSGQTPTIFNLFVPDIAVQEKILVLADSGKTDVHFNTADWSRYQVTGSPRTLAYFNFEKEYETAEAIKTRNALAIRLPKFRRDTVEGKATIGIVETFSCYLLKTDTVGKEKIASYQSLLGQDKGYGQITFQNREVTPAGDLIMHYYGDSSELHLNKVMYKHLMLNRDNYVGALIAYQHFADSHYRKEADSAYGLLTPGARNTRFGESLKTYIDLNTFWKAADFSFTDIKGRRIQLSSLKSRYVLVHFWASWCGNCRPPNKLLADLYRRTSREQLEYVNISLDLSKADWKKAIKTDGLPGYHTSELNGFDNSIAGMYNVRAVPSSFLLDNKGNILLINPDMVSYIEQKIQSTP